MSVLKEGLLIDLNNILINLPDLISQKQNIETASKYPDLINNLEISNSSSTYISKILSGTHPAYIIKNFSEQQEIKTINRNLNNSLYFVSLVSESFRDTLSNNTWISLKEFNDDYLKDQNLFKIYLGLLFQKGNNIMFKVKSPSENYYKLTTLQSFLRDNKDNTGKIFPYFYNFLKYSTDIDNNIKEIKDIKRKTDTINWVDNYGYLKSSVNLLEFGMNFYNLFSPEQILNDSAIIEFIDITKKGCEIYKNMNEKNYSAAIMNSFYLFDYATKSGKITERIQIDLKQENIDDKTKGDYETKLAVIKRNNNEKPELLKYLAFASYFVQSNSNDEIITAVESIAYPYGKTNKNKHNVFSITLNSYTGLFCGNENITGNIINTAGIFAPVGIAFKHSISRKNSQYIGFYVSLFNVGELTSFRLQYDFRQNLPDMKIENIFTPGGYFVYGLPKMPLAVGIGAQYGPAYRNTYNHANTLPFNYSVNVFISVDLSFFNFYSKQGVVKTKQSNKSLL